MLTNCILQSTSAAFSLRKNISRFGVVKGFSRAFPSREGKSFLYFGLQNSPLWGSRYPHCLKNNVPELSRPKHSGFERTLCFYKMKVATCQIGQTLIADLKIIGHHNFGAPLMPLRPFLYLGVFFVGDFLTSKNLQWSCLHRSRPVHFRKLY